MTRDEIIHMAQLCDLGRVCGPLDTLLDHEWEDLHRFAALIAEREREATLAKSNASWKLMCQKMVEAEREACLEIADQCANADMPASMAANAVRARSTK